MSDYLKIPELADRLDVSEKTARTYVKNGVIPSAFIGGAYRVSEEDLEAFVESRRSKPPKPLAQPSEAESEAARGQTPWEQRQSVIKAARAHTPWDQLQGVIKLAEGTCAHWESRLDGAAALSNDEVRSLASFGPTLARTLDSSTNAELRDLRYQYPDMDDVRPLSRLEPVRYRWAGVMIRADRLGLKPYPDTPEAQQAFRELREWLEGRDREHV